MDYFGVDKKKNGDHFGVGIISGSIWGSFKGWGSFRGRDHFGGCTDLKHTWTIHEWRYSFSRRVEIRKSSPAYIINIFLLIMIVVGIEMFLKRQIHLGKEELIVKRDQLMWKSSTLQTEGRGIFLGQCFTTATFSLAVRQIFNSDFLKYLFYLSSRQWQIFQ